MAEAESIAPAVSDNETEGAGVVGMEDPIPVVNDTAGTPSKSNVPEISSQISEDEDDKDADLALFLPADIPLDLPNQQTSWEQYQAHLSTT